MKGKLAARVPKVPRGSTETKVKPIISRSRGKQSTIEFKRSELGATGRLSPVVLAVYRGATRNYSALLLCVYSKHKQLFLSTHRKFACSWGNRRLSLACEEGAGGERSEFGRSRAAAPLRELWALCPGPSASGSPALSIPSGLKYEEGI